jgi:ABC-type transport system involved in multi-copper enzyme maturation permease subunit
MGPSVMRADEPFFARWVGATGLMLVTVGSVALLVAARGIVSRFVGPGLGTLFFITGLACLLFHAVRETDVQMRRVYGILGFLFLAAGVLVSALPIKGAAGSQFLPYGFVSMTLALLFLLPFLRNETEANYRQGTLTVLGLVGAVLAATGFIGGNASENFLLPYGLLLTLLGIAYLWAFVGVQGTSSDMGYRAGVALGVAGLFFFLFALGRSVIPWLLYYKLHWIRARPDAYLVPSGLVLMFLGLLYAGLAAGLCSESRLAVLTRRELAAFFYSPIAYIVLFGLTLVGWVIFLLFVYNIFREPDPRRGAPLLLEPVVSAYILDWPTAVVLIFVVPVLTMRLVSEENRTGTLEVLLTAPLSETVVVLSKFLATFIFFLAAWLPWGLFLVSMRIEGGAPFEYRPLLSFFIALACSGANFLGLGLFLSSLTRNQIAAAVLSFVGMVMMTGLAWGAGIVKNDFPASAWVTVLEHASYLHLWGESLLGKLAPQHLLFHISAAVFWLFLTVKVLESRKWR